MANESPVAIALGSNLGDRLEYLSSALLQIDRIEAVQVIATSRVYESAAWGGVTTDAFLNAVLLAQTALSPEDLLRRLQQIEDSLGRQRDQKWGARTLDLDMLAYGELRLESASLQLPHPWIGKRPFVYLPFRELLPRCPQWVPLLQADPEALTIEAETRPTDFGSPLWGTQADLTGRLEIFTHSEEETQSLATRLAAYLAPGDLIALNAPMGSGKSVFSRGIARGLGIEGPIQSPTFTLCRTYAIPRGGTFEHWDFYRLGSEDELESTGYFSPLATKPIRAVEWAENFPRALGRPLLFVTIEPLENDTRRLTFSAPGGLPFFVKATLAVRG